MVQIVSRQHLNISMILNRGKNCKSQTATRTVAHSQKLTTGLGIAKKSDPFFKDLKQIYDKENISPNLKDIRVKSHHIKPDNAQKSPNKKINPQLPNKSHAQNVITKQKKQHDQLSSSSKFNNSAELHKAIQNTKLKNRKSTQKDDVIISHFQEEYYNKKQERREKKMRVTLKDIKKHRKSIQQSQQEYQGKLQEQTKESFSKDLISSLKLQHQKQEIIQNKLKTEESLILQFPGLEESKCDNHPQKRASHRLLEGDSNVVLCQKCAINLITKGHKMQQLQNTSNISMHKEDMREARLDKLKGFLLEVDSLQPIIKQSWCEIGSYRNLVQQKFQEETIQLNQYYEKIRSQVQQSYSKSQINLRIYFQSVVEELEKNEDLLKKNQQLLKEFKWDILPNINQIVQTSLVAQQNFIQIIQNYYKNLKNIELNLKDISEYSYCAYEYEYDASNLRLSNLKDLLTPQIKILTLRQKCEPTRNTLSTSSQKKMDPFRLSFGKKIPQISHRIL